MMEVEGDKIFIVWVFGIFCLDSLNQSCLYRDLIRSKVGKGEDGKLSPTIVGWGA